MPNLASRSAEDQTLERVYWVEGFSFLAYGRRIGVRANESGMVEQFRVQLPFGSKPCDGGRVDRLYSVVTSSRRGSLKSRASYRLFADTGELARSDELGDIVEMFGREVRLFVAAHARHRIFVHAAAIGWKGQAIVIPGKSLSGKTSLAAEFVRAGASYYSDEYAVLDEHGRVHPYAKPLSLRMDGDDSYRQTDYPVESFGGHAGTRPLRVGLVLVTQYRKGSRWRPRPLSPAMGTMALLANTIAARKQPERTMDVLTMALRTGLAVKSLRGEAIDVVESVLTSYDWLRIPVAGPKGKWSCQ